MFHKATKSLAKQLDPEGDLIPVRCLVDHQHFTPLCLVQRKSKNSWWQKHRYYRTDYKLRDVLLPEEHTPQLDICDSDPFTIVDHVDGKLEGDVSVATDLATLKMTSSTNLSHARSVKVKKRHINTQVLDSLSRKSKINLDHPLIKQSEKFQKDLYVITETVEATEQAEFEDSNKLEGSILAELHVKMNFKGLKDSRKAIIIPKDCTLAFRVKRLIIRDGSLGISLFPDDRRTTFYSRAIRLQGDGVSVDVKIRTEKQLMEFEQECAPLLLLSPDLQGKFLNVFLAIMRNNDLLQELELQVEEALDGIHPMKLKTGRPELQELVDNLQDSTGAICHEIAEPVLYFLQALDELSESELLLLEESVERKIVSKQTALVRHILEKLASNIEETVTIDPQDVSSFIEDELDVTEAMVKLRGVTVQKSGDNLTVMRNPDALSALSVLYVALYVLDLLSK